MPQRKTQKAPAKLFRKPNAMKHGAFSAIDILPWENAEDFEKICTELADQYHSRGPLQEDCIRGIADLMWRKRRVRQKRLIDFAAEFERLEYKVLWQNPLPLSDTHIEHVKEVFASMEDTGRDRVKNDHEELFRFSSSLYRFMGVSFLPGMIKMLPKEFADHLQEKFPEANFPDRSDWVVALKREVDQVLLPMVKKRYPFPTGYYEAAAKLATPERILADLDLEERFDTAIDRLLKRFFSLQMADELNDRKFKMVTSKD
ncbi:hypothetical protein [Bradyrhizobium symbiodeficiens]|uniref:hypothetical protein n=1 Tax=Bradyrhizobium symbiodeficiens TaxID=1404367 RepID=UPI00140F807C|nr:hypothetical protein [Bradyrhizobium symbiodeficiens]QIO98828.1 hypothetical protein HAU86_02950 [Bradyrhizobium symbiodeficiens]